MDRILSIKGLKLPAWAPHAAALLGLIVYLIQALIFAHTTISNLDEGGYLLKGWLFASGEYRPFDPGIWTNKAPFAFLIPGYVQLLFGPGLRTGRYLAVFFGVMAVVGTWVAARRLSGKWLAAGAVWIFALSPAVIKYYSGGATQSTVAFMLAWSLALALGENRSSWQLALSGFLAGAMMLVRQNMMPVLPLLVMYAFWQHGWRALWMLITGGMTVGIVLLIYWPDILQLWTWIPYIRMPAGTSYAGGGTPSWIPQIVLNTRLLSVFQAFRFHFAALAGGIGCLMLWPRMKAWCSRAAFRAGLFLLILFGGLVYMHSVAAIGQDYCVYCFAPYMAFFNVAGIILLVLAVKSWNWQPSILAQAALVIILLGLSAGMGYSAFEDLGSFLLNLPVPRVRDMTILPGFVTWREILANRFHLDINPARKIVSGVFGFSAGVLGTLLALGLWRRFRGKLGAMNFGSFYTSIFLLIGIILSPLLAGSGGSRDCTVDVIRSNEDNGAYLRGIIPSGSLVYWDGGLSAAPLLYLPGIEIFPAQINSGYSFLSGGDTAQLHKFGLWNEELRAQWMAEAEFFIIEEARYTQWVGVFTPDLFDEYVRTPLGTSCLEDTRLRIFRRK